MHRVIVASFAVAAVSGACALGQSAERESIPPAIGSVSEALATPDGQIENWEERSAPQARSFHSLAYDEERQETVLFGGMAISGMATGTWTWNGIWTRRNPALSPPFRTGAAMTYDSDRKRVILFGGQTSFGLSNETWTWDGKNWTLLAPAVRPSERHNSTMAYDPIRKVAVLFGGQSYAGGMDETWTYDGTTWKLEPSASKPPANRNVSMVFDKARQTIAMPIQGTTGCSVDLMRWNGSTWSPWSVTGATPQACAFSASFDAKQNTIVLVGMANVAGTWTFTNWSFDGTSWTNTTPAQPPRVRNGIAMTFDSKRGEVLSFGGNTVDVYGASRQLDRRSGTTWTIDASTTPTARFASIASPGPSGSIVVFGGILNTYSNETWTFDGKGWREERPPISPSPRYLSQMAFDERRNQTVLYSGRSDVGFFNDTWIWDGSTWTKKSPAHVPGYVDGQMTYDSVRERVWLIDTGIDPVRTWSWDGQDWERIQLGPAPPRRTQAAVAFDRARGVVVVFGGQGDSGVVDDTWTWDGATWTALSPIDRPAPRYLASLAWDDARKQLVLFGGQGQSGNLNDVWGWDGKNWTPLVNPNATVLPATRYWQSFVPIAKTGNILLIGGQSNEGPLDDQWVFRTRGGSCTDATQCGSGACVDGVCCESAACETCQTCGGIDRGLCEPIRNAEDPDTCALKSGKRCDAEGKCLGGAGATCKTSTDCSTGFCVDGFCCNTSCDLPCEACSAATKQIATDDGRCGPAKVGTNPGNRCSDRGSCNASGVCETRTEAACISNNVLDLGGGATQDCAPYTCKGGACMKKCASYIDCTFPASCSTDGRCEVKEGLADAGGCSLTSRNGGSRFAALSVLGLGLVLRRRRRLGARSR